MKLFILYKIEEKMAFSDRTFNSSVPQIFQILQYSLKTSNIFWNWN